MTVSASREGWTAVRAVVFRRDIGCVAGQRRVFGGDIADEPCRDQFGTVIPYDALSLLEFDHVTRNGVRYDDEAHGIAVCPWHHRLSQRWRSDSKAHRALEREWLAKHYPEVWDAIP